MYGTILLRKLSHRSEMINLCTLGLFCLLAAACNPATPPLNTPGVSPLPRSTAIPPTITPTPSPTLASTPTLPPLPTTPPQFSLYLESYLPPGLASQISLPANVTITGTLPSDFSLEIWGAPGLIRWVYALVAPFPSLVDGISSQTLRQAWNGGLSNSSSTGHPLVLDESTYGVFSTWWGTPPQGVVEVLPAGQLLEYAWGHPQAWAIIPFEALEPRWKVLEIDGQSPLQKTFNPNVYPLLVPFGLLDAEGMPVQELPEGWTLPPTNRQPDKLTILDMTGVTALVRGTALWMERFGITYPAEDIGPLLQQADLTHISNEIPFTPDCPFPELYPSELVFCSQPDYIQLLEQVGADLVELTGDHFGDWGASGMKYTLDLYQQHNWPVYGGGLNADQARQPLLIEHNGNKLAFLGCNIGCEVKNEVPCTALATIDQPGAARCDFEWLSAEIPRLREAGYLVIFTFQHKEYYATRAEPDLVNDFSRIAEAGASIISGSQAHQPHGMAFENGAFIHYGLGNLFFDQYHFCEEYACDFAFIDQHVFYNGEYISTELIPIRFIDLAKPRLMTGEEQEEFLRLIFATSGWQLPP